MNRELLRNFNNGMPVNNRGQELELLRAQRQLENNGQQLPATLEYIGFPRNVIVRAPGIDEQGAFWGGNLDLTKDILIPGQDEYDGREMAKQMRVHGFLDTVEYPCTLICLAISLLSYSSCPGIKTSLVKSSLPPQNAPCPSIPGALTMTFLGNPMYSRIAGSCWPLFSS